MTGDPTQRGALPISIRGITKTYGPVRALEGVDLDVEAGEFVTLLGPSGSGKTTLLMVLAGFTRPDRGSVLFGGQEVVRSPPHKRGVGMVFQNYALFPHMNVRGNVGYPLRLRGLARAEVGERVSAVLDLVRLQGLGERKVHELSGGQRQRVALARAIVFEPRILLMDEPLSALDKKLREHMQIELRRLHEKLGMTTVYVTHDQREALTMSDRVAVIDHGRLMQVDQPRRLYERPNSRFVAEFIGESSFLPVTLEGDDALLDGRRLHLETPLPEGEGQRLLLLRPEKLEILPDGAGGRFNRVEGTVQDTVYQGESFVVYVTLGNGTEITLRSPARSALLDAVPPAGEPVTLWLHARDTLIVPGT